MRVFARKRKLGRPSNERVEAAIIIALENDLLGRLHGLSERRYRGRVMVDGFPYDYDFGVELDITDLDLDVRFDQ
jgi:hypothetical protein